MTMWEFACCIEGFNRANGGAPKISAPSDEEFEQAVARLH